MTDDAKEIARRFRKLPVEIDAWQFKFDALDAMPAWIEIDWLAHEELYIPTLEGIMLAHEGDWIIRGVKGEVYPVRPDIFTATYEPATPPAPEALAEFEGHTPGPLSLHHQPVDVRVDHGWSIWNTEKVVALINLVSGTKADLELWTFAPTLLAERDSLLSRLARAEEQLAQANAKLNLPEIDDFLEGVKLEAAHQRERWSESHDADKTDADWFWLLGYLAGKALHGPANSMTPEIVELGQALAATPWHAARRRRRK